MLDWYDINGRTLPWRSAQPDPYHVVLSEFMLQQTTVKAVIPYFERFTKLWPTVEDIANANLHDVLAQWAGLGYYNRAKNLHKMANAVAELGSFPDTPEELRSLPGIGEYTADAVASIAFGKDVLPLDGNIKRILARLYEIDAPIDRISAAMRHAQSQWSRAMRARDTPQAFMDLASAICRPKNPNCAQCPLNVECSAFRNGTTDNYPKRAAKRAKKEWVGHIYIIENANGIALVNRDEGQVLGGMRALPASNWGEQSSFDPPIDAQWRELGTIIHVFTHIRLSARIWYCLTRTQFGDNQFTFKKNPAKDLPSLWRKALELKPDR